MSDDEVQSHETNGTGHLAMDEAFSARMRAAIAAGLENAPIVSSSRLEPKSPIHPSRAMAASVLAWRNGLLV
jgi:hypothetical protein